MRPFWCALLFLPLSWGQHAQVVATKTYVDNAVAHGGGGGTIPNDAHLPGSPTTTTQASGTSNDTVATTAFVHGEVQAASSILLFSGVTINGSDLASGASETGTLAESKAKDGSACIASPSDSSVPAVGVREYCRVSAGVVTITRRNETSDAIHTETRTYNGAVFQ